MRTHSGSFDSIGVGRFRAADDLRTGHSIQRLGAFDFNFARSSRETARGLPKLAVFAARLPRSQRKRLADKKAR